MSIVQRLAQANYVATRMPIGIIDAFDGSVLVGCGWQTICVEFHRANPHSLERCRESDEYIKGHLSSNAACEYRCKNGLRDIGVPIVVAGEHLATLFLGQFFYEGESPDRAFFERQAREFGYDDARYLAALDRVPTFPRSVVENIVAYDRALVRFIGELAEAALRHSRDQQALRESEERFRMLADNIPQLAWSADAHGRIGWFNQRWFEYTGRSPDAPPDGSEEGLVHPDHQERVLAKIRHCFDAGEPWEDTFPIQGKDGSYRWFLSRMHPIRDGAGNVTRWFGTNTDVTEQREAEQALRDADRRKDEFLSVLSHELRNPLAPIRNSVYILNHSEPASERTRRARAVIERQVDHLTRLVDDLLDVTRIARGKIELQRGDVDVASVVRRTAEDLRSVVCAQGVELAVELPAEPVIVDGDAMRLAQVLGNLLQNAAKFTPGGGVVRLSLRALDGAAEIRVRDTGIGIEPPLLERIFEPFVQAESSLARTDGGLGLGLALVKGITVLHGGTVRAESAGAGTGAEFVVRLPLAAAAESLPAADAAAPLAGHRRVVLVVDDTVDAAG
jgi:PAS domain S-box-containing protein